MTLKMKMMAVATVLAYHSAITYVCRLACMTCFKSNRTCLVNHMGFMSCYIMPLLSY